MDRIECCNENCILSSFPLFSLSVLLYIFICHHVAYAYFVVRLVFFPHVLGNSKHILLLLYFVSHGLQLFFFCK